MKRLVTTSLFILTISFSFSQQINPLIAVDDFENQQKWVDSIYGNMSLQEKVGQLFMADVFSSDSKLKTNKVKDLIKDFYIGGVIFSKGGPKRQAKLNNEFQNLAKTKSFFGG